MRWLVDECVDAAVAADLRHSGHDVVELADLAPAARSWMSALASDRGAPGSAGGYLQDAVGHQEACYLKVSERIVAQADVYPLVFRLLHREVFWHERLAVW